MDCGDRRIRLTAVQAVAVAAIEGATAAHFLVIDLFLDDPQGAATRPRVVRMKTCDFDPRSVVGGDTATAALSALIAGLLAASSARPIPDRTAVLGPAFRSFASVERYEQVLIGASTS
jgi:hypothetical protein